MQSDALCRIGSASLNVSDRIQSASSVRSSVICLMQFVPRAIVNVMERIEIATDVVWKDGHSLTNDICHGAIVTWMR